MKQRLTLLLAAIIAPLLLMAADANSVLAKTAAKLTSAKSVTAKFTGSASGSIVVSGNKFTMMAGGNGVWYDGTNMWTYSKKAGETSLTNPTQAELMESNPMEVIKAYKTSFNARKVSEKGDRCTIKLTPRKKGSSVKEATLTVNTSTWMPVSIDVIFSNSQRMTFNITSISEGGALSPSTFVYPASNYKGVEVVDLR